MAISPSVEERLLDQLHDWDEWARGYPGWPSPVRLEPPFRRFPGHELPYLPVHDDGWRPTVMSQFVDSLLGRQRNPAPPLPPAITRPPDPEPLDDATLRTFDAVLSREYALRDDAAGAFLMSLSGARGGIAFEIVGTSEGAVVQVSCRTPDEAVLRRSLATYCPGVTLTEGPDRLRDFIMEYPETPVAVAHLALAREFFIPLAYPGKLSPDPLLAVFAALDDIPQGELAAMQALFEPARQPWAPSIIRAVTNSEGEDFFWNAPEVTKLAKRKALQPLYGVVLRILAAGETEYDIRSRFVRLATALSQFEAPDRNGFLIVNEDRLDDEDFLLDTLLRRSHRSGMLLSLEELLPLVHFPAVAGTSLRIVGRETRRTKAAPSPHPAGVAIGVNVHAGRSTPIHLDAERLRRHIHVVGASGSGKSNLLLELLAEDIRQGGGVALLDPHGDLVDDLVVRIPASRQKDVILFDPSDEEWPVGMNVLQAHSDVERTLLASDLVGIFRRLSTSWGDQMHTVLAQAIQAMLESKSGGTIADLRRFLVDPECRREFLATTEDEETIFYWTKQYPLLRGRPESPILTRLDAFLRPRLIRNIVVQKNTPLDFRKIMDDGKIFLAKLAQGAIGEENAALLGSFLVAKFHQVAMSRQNTALESRRTFLLAIDEFQHFVTPSMASLLTGARKFALGLALSHQDLHQLQSRDAEVYHAVLANAGTRICFRLSDHDAKQLAEGFSFFTADDLRTLPVGEAICRFGTADRDFNLAVPLAKPIDGVEAAARRERIRSLSRAAYARKLDRDKPLDAPQPKPATPEAKEPREPTPAPQPRAERQRHERSMERLAPPLGRGGPQHKYLQSLIKQIGEAHGCRATIEYPLPGNESVDVLLERDGYRIACEISVASTAGYEAGNLRKCLASGFDEVFLLAAEEKKLRKLETSLGAVLTGDERRRVAFVTAEEFLARLAAANRPPEDMTVGGYNVRVSYRPPAAGEGGNRQQTIASVLAGSLRKLTEG
jgi:hypothetical protein